MKYMLLIHYNEDEWEAMSDAEKEQVYAGYRELGSDLGSRGVLLEVADLQATTTATTVRIRDGEPLLSDGPIIET